MLKTLAASVRQYKKASLLTPLLVAFESMLDIIIPTLMAYMIDYGISTSRMSYVLRMGLIMVAVALTSLLTGA
ncbi:MAG TPA: ABC transporter ATP-binding protein, partial [Clostridia bacterium]|nr:ABC transporter ATP-binding protein [Clostridia bacterium]